MEGVKGSLRTWPALVDWDFFPELAHGITWIEGPTKEGQQNRETTPPPEQMSEEWRGVRSGDKDWPISPVETPHNSLTQLDPQRDTQRLSRVNARAHAHRQRDAH